ncbi:serine/threonine protein kinase [Humitalea sp. 24SJ18S-53]|uniref:serine/threonine protein kinase n=1 Tax=Humitalea sp. 24SJ18S-53 TaxID=3422307 RepID=UPI003D66A94A
MVPDTIGGFTPGDVLHRGGMAVLREATHPDHPGPLLLKLPLVAEGDDPAAIVGFEMEQMIMPRLSGPHVPHCFGVGYEPLPWIAMERIEGASLLPLLDTLPRPAGEVAEIGAAIADALDSLHRQGVVHLDIKPANIVRRPDGAVVLVDFGVSHHAQLPDLLAEEFHLPYGSAPYMAPEQVIGVRGDPASDVFALGAIMYHLATGRTPFGDPQHLRAMKRRLWWDPPPPRARQPDCPPWLQEVILRCMEVAPQRRYGSAAHLAFDLRHADHVALTARAGRTRRDPWTARIRRRFHPDHQQSLVRAVAAPHENAPIVVVALDLDTMSEGLTTSLRRVVRNVLATIPGARVACVNVLRTRRVLPDAGLDDAGRNKHVQLLIALRHWSASLNLPEQRLTHHVLEALNPAEALLDYASHNRVDHIILGARADGIGRRLLGSVAAEVARDAPCSVTVVRQRGHGSDRRAAEAN